MQIHLEQVKHNQELFDIIHNLHNNRFNDWKITILFYTANHCLKAFAANQPRPINIGRTHKLNLEAINPDNPNAKLQLSNKAFKNYQALMKYSRSARYNGFTDLSTFEVLRHHEMSLCENYLKDFKNYIRSKGTTLP